MMSGKCLRGDKRIISSYAEDLYSPKNEMVSRTLMPNFIFCGLRL
jgi:hypothetical protein